MAANSTVMYSGLDPGSKSSSKVLAPPGGRSSISFCGGDEPAVEAPKEQPAAQPEEVVEQVQETKVEEVPKEVAPDPEEKVETAEEEAAHTLAMGPVGRMVEPAVLGRTKVPPGGFSSGAFW